jgi:uncharacterized protein (DUF1015 family)
MSVMVDIAPFRALRYAPSAGPLGDLVCPPYDVISLEQREALYAESPRNFVRVEFGRAEPPDGGGMDRYAQSRVLVEQWLRAGILRSDDRPAFYLHDHIFDLGGQWLRRRGLFAALRLYPLDGGIVLPHEQTIPKDKTDRLELLRKTRVNTSPVFGLFEDPRREVADAMDEWAERPPMAEARVGTERHALRLVDDPAVVRRLRAALRDARVYLADGHHRYEVALGYLNEQLAGGAAISEDSPEHYVLTYLCALDDPGLRIFPTHRVVTGARVALDAAIRRSFEASPIDRGALGDTQPGVVLVRDAAFTRLEPRRDADLSNVSALWRSLPVAEAETLLVEPARRAGGQVRYEHDTERAIDAAVGETDAILVRAVDAMTLKRVADAGERLPPKTTYFYPKVPAGLVVRSLDPS